MSKSSSIASLPITTARSEPRMISTMSPIAIPMPAPPPKPENYPTAADDLSKDDSDKVLLIDVDSDNAK